MRLNTDQAMPAVAVPAPHRRRKRATTGQLETALAAATTGIALYKQGSEWYKRLTSRPTYMLTVTSDDSLYGDALTALLELIPSENRRALTVAYNRSSRAGVAPISLIYSGSVTHTIVLGGQPIEASVSLIGKRPGSSSAAVPQDSDGDDPWWDVLPKKLSLVASDEAGRDAATAWLSALAEKRRNRGNPPQIHLLARWGDWQSIGEVAGRPPESVALAAGQLERIADDLGRFLGSRDAYDRIGIPWHRGYLFEGPPGGGKSSVARVLAGLHNLDLWYLPLSDVSSDTDILRQVAQIRGGILLIEDVDVFRAATTRTDDDDRKVSLQGVLNALDGVATPAGLITIMATNDPDSLDAALVRPGRVDLRETFGPIADVDQADRILRNAYGDAAPPAPEAVVGRMPAEVVGIVKDNLSDPDGARAALDKLVS